MLSEPVVGIANWRLTRCPGMCRSAPGHRKGHGSALPCDQCDRIREPAMRYVICCGEWPLGTRWADSQVRGSHRPRRSLLLRFLRPGGGLPGPEWGRQDDHGARRLRSDRAGLRDCQVERGPCRPERAPPLRVHAGGARSVSGHARRRAARHLGRLHGMSVPDAPVATRTWLERLGVADRADSKVDALPHGNQQRVQLAAALVHGPELLVLDEPLAGLDPTGIDAIGEVLVEQARSGWCVLFSSHQLDQVEDLCEEVTIIDHGRLVVTEGWTTWPAAVRAGWWCGWRGAGTRRGPAAFPGSPCRRSMGAKRDSCSTSRWTASR